MRNILIYLFVIFIAAGCDHEDQLAPTLKEKDWSDSLDMSVPMVKECYEKYGFGLLTKFDVTRDVAYNIDSYWQELMISRMDRTTEIDSAFTFFQESFLQYFTKDEFIKKYFPRKIILTREVFLNKTSNPYCTQCMESDARVSATAVNSLHSIFSKGSFVFSAKLDAIYYSEKNYQDYKLDNLYLFLSYLFEINDFYNVFGIDFYLSDMASYYGRHFSGGATIYTGNKPGVYVEEGGAVTDQTTSVSWYWNKGFVSTAYLNPVNAQGKIQLRDQSIDGNFAAYAFPQKEREVRTLINQMIFMSQSIWNKYPTVVKNRIAILMKQFDEWGIDIRAINPVMESAFPRQ